MRWIGGLLIFFGLFAIPMSPFLGLALIVLGLIIAGIVVINQYEKAVKFRLGKYVGTLEPGIHWIIPLVERIVKVDMRIRTVDIPSQEVITKDNVPVKVNGVVYFRVENPEKAVLEVKNYEYAVAQYSQTALRDVVGKIDLDDLLSKREVVAEEIRKIVDEIAQKWGVDIVSINLQDVVLPPELIRAMARQAEAERERRAVILKSEGEIEAAKNLLKAAKVMEENPGAIFLRTLYTLVDISGDPNQKVVIFIPVEMLEFFQKFVKR